MSERQQPTSDTVAETDLLRGLARLENLAKAQLTGKLTGNAAPKGTWADGKEPSEVDESDSDVSGDGGEGSKKSDTDYRPKASPVRKGLADEDEEPSDEDAASEEEESEEDAGPPADEDDDDEAEKSLVARAEKSRAIRKAVEVSPFLRDWGRALAKGFQDLARRNRRDLRRELRKALARQATFDRGVADVLSKLSNVALEQGQLLKAIAAQPARGPKSQTTAVRPVEKSFEAGGEATVTLPDGTTVPQLPRAVVLERLVNGVAKGLIHASEVVKFEATGVVHPGLYKSIATNPELAK